MKEEKLFIRYLAEHWRMIASYLAFLSIYAVLIKLLGMPLGIVLYGALLCGTLAAVCFLLGFIKYVRLYRGIQTLKRQERLELSMIPPAGDLLQLTYQDIIRQLESKRCKLEQEKERREESTRQYYTMWAHQIKTPISAMRLLLRDLQDEQAHAQMGQELFKIEQYVDMVLQYLRLEGGANDLVLEEYSLDDIIRQAVKRTATLFIHKKLALDFQETGMRVVTDEKWMVFVLEQIFTNAVKYTPKGTVTVRGKKEENTLLITDTGIGIREEDLPRIFEWGFTGCNGRVDKRSTGIGLHLCQQVLRLIGHSIRLESQAGEGTSVYLTFPRRDSLPYE